MAVEQEIYIDPSIAADSGAGTVGDPYGDLQYAFNQVTIVTGNNRFNIKVGTAEVLAAALTAPIGVGVNSYMTIEGYTTAAGDGGIGEIDCNGTQCMTGTFNYVYFRKMFIHTSGASVHLFSSRPLYSHWSECHLRVSDGRVFSSVSSSSVYRCYLEGTGGTANSNMLVYQMDSLRDCYLNTGVLSGVYAGGGTHCSGNIIVLNSTGAVYGAYLYATNPADFSYNSILNQAAGTGYGVLVASCRGGFVDHNLIEGFSGAGGDALTSSGGYPITSKRIGNSYYNCTNGDNPSETTTPDNDTELLDDSPFAKVGSLPTDFSDADFWDDLYTYFAPVDTGNVLAERRARGAVQAAAGGAAGMLRRSSQRGGYE